MLLEGRLIRDPGRPPRSGWIETDGDRIADLAEGPPPRAPDVGDAGALICPGFIDAHVHLPQFEAIGFDGLELLARLDRAIYPAEAAWGDPGVASRRARRALRRLLRSGTLGFAGYLSSHRHAVAETAAAGRDLPLRARAGQVLMDRHGPSELLVAPEPPEAAGDARLEVSVNPRFAVACSDALLERAAGLAGADGWIQTHLAETTAECRLVAELFPQDASYAAVYDRHGLLTPRTLLAHCLHLDEAQWRLVAERGCTVVHCPTANAFLGAGLFDLGSARRHGVRVALGSDVAAGPDVAMPRVARAMIDVARLRRAAGDRDAPVPRPDEAWTMITRGNAEALGWSDAGRLEPGAAADLLVLDAPFDADEQLVSRLIYTWDDAYIAARVVAGAVIEAG